MSSLSQTAPAAAGRRPPVAPRPATSAATRPDVGPTGRIARGTATWRAMGIALFCAGFSSFALIYCVQPLLPALAQDFGLDAATSALALSLTTGCLALSIFVLGALSQGLGRKGLMSASMLAAAGLNLAVAFAPSWHLILLCRAVEGLVLGGVPAVAMAYLAEEIEPADLGKAMGLYIGGTAFGAMMGRVGMGVLTEVASWHVAMALLGGLCLVSALLFVRLLPASRHFERQPGMRLGQHLALWRGHLANPALRRVYAIGFCLTSVFVTVFNYTTFRLVAAPYGLGQTTISMIFLAFALGIFSSQIAGSLSDRLGRRALLVVAFVTVLAGVLLTLAASLWLICAGIALVATGFFVGHSVASGAVGAWAEGGKGHAASLYLLFYYIGASLVGWGGGWFWQAGGWTAVAGMTAAVALLGALLGLGAPRRG